MHSVILVSVFQIVINFTVGPDTQFLAVILNSLGNPALLSILGARLLFNMKEAGEHGVNEGTDWGSHTASSIHFEDGSGTGQYVPIPFRRSN